MKAYVVKQWRGPRGGHLKEWWWFFTDPYVFSVWWSPIDRWGNRSPKTMEQYRNEQIASVRAYLVLASVEPPAGP